MNPLRLVLFFAVVLLGAGCGSVCNRIENAERGINAKGEGCSRGQQTVHSASTCNEGLSSCSPDDVDKLNQYADCLERQPQCDSSTSVSWSLAVAGCAQPLFGISGKCLSAIQ